MVEDAKRAIDTGVKGVAIEIPSSDHIREYPIDATRADKVRERIDKSLETHFHMDLDMGVANTVMAVTAGVETIQTTVSGIG